MKYSLLGDTGVFVSKLCLGTMTFGGNEDGKPYYIGSLSQKDTTDIIHGALHNGVNFIDTADVYKNGQAEEQIGVSLKNKRSEVILATKFGGRLGDGPNDVGFSKVHFMKSLEGSLRRLKTDYIDLYQIHTYDPFTPIDEIISALEQATKQGKIIYSGCSNFTGWQISKSIGISDEKKSSSFVSNQAYYSLACRDIEHEVIPAAIDSGLSLLCWSPLAGGLLTGKFTQLGTSDAGARRINSPFPPVNDNTIWDILKIIIDIAKIYDASPAQISLAWLLSRKEVTSVIFGAKSYSQLIDNMKSIDLSISEEHLHLLDSVSSPGVRYPAWMQSYRAKERAPKGYHFEGKTWSKGDEPC